MDTSTLAPWPQFSSDEIQAVSKVLESGKVNYWTGTETRQFETRFAKLCATQYAVAVANGTVALQLALEAVDIGPGDEVIVTPRSFIASASCVVRSGAAPVFADVDKDSQNITPETVQRVITPNTRAIIAVHHAGWPCEMEGLMKLARSHGLTVIEDCAQAHGAIYRKRPVGGIGHVGAFSFCQDKIITTGGEGGMLVMNDPDVWRRVWSLKDHGKSYEAVHNSSQPPGFRWLHEYFGSNERMTEMQAAIGQIQIEKLNEWKARRTANARQLSETLGQHPVVRVPDVPAHIEHAFYRLYAFVVPDLLAGDWSRDRIVAELAEKGVPCFSGTCPEIYNEKAFDGTSFRPDHPLPVARSLGPISLAFLVHPTLTDTDLSRVKLALSDVLERASL